MELQLYIPAAEAGILAPEEDILVAGHNLGVVGSSHLEGIDCRG